MDRFIPSFISQSLILFGFVYIPIFLLVWIQEEVGIELGADSKCASKDEGEKLKVKVLVKWSGNDWLA